MKNHIFISLVMTVLMTLNSCECRKNDRYVSYTDTVEVNGVSLFYAAEGCGKPVILLHGNGGSHNDLETTTRQLAQAGYMVYALDSRGQGANAPLDEYHYKDMAEDVYQFIQLKELKKPAVFGFSDGGVVALQLEVMHPGTWSAITTGGANIFVENALTDECYKSLTVAAQESNNPLTVMMLREPDMSADEIATIGCPALIMAGENDLILEQHTRLIADAIPRGEMLIVPQADHGSYIQHNTLVGTHILDFFNRIGY